MIEGVLDGAPRLLDSTEGELHSDGVVIPRYQDTKFTSTLSTVQYCLALKFPDA